MEDAPFPVEHLKREVSFLPILNVINIYKRAYH